jgi:hypothetical protein
VVEEQRSRRESRGCRALDGPSLAALLARPETKGRGRHRPEREKDGRGSFFAYLLLEMEFFACSSRFLCTMHMGICLSHFAMACWSQSNWACVWLAKIITASVIQNKSPG